MWSDCAEVKRSHDEILQKKYFNFDRIHTCKNQTFILKLWRLQIALKALSALRAAPGEHLSLAGCVAREQTAGPMPGPAYGAAACSRGSGHREGPRELTLCCYALDAPLGKVCSTAPERASINIYLVYLFSLAAGLVYLERNTWGKNAGLVHQRSPSANLTRGTERVKAAKHSKLDG